MTTKSPNELEKQSRPSSLEYEKDQALLASDPNVRRKADNVPFPAWFIILNELCERFAFYGASLLFQVYLIGELGLAKSSATAVNRGFTFFAYFTAFLGAVIADVWLGRFKTIATFSCVYMVGLIVLTVSALPGLKASFGFAGFILSTYVFIAFGTGGIKANVSAFAAEQVKPGIQRTDDPGVVIDSNVTVESVFRYFYWAINVGAMLGMAICPIVAHHSYSAAFLIPACLFAVGVVVFFLGRARYVTKAPDGTVLIRTYRILRYAASTRGEPVEHWLDRAKGVPGAEWSDKFVDELKRTLQACAVFIFYPFYWALYNNMSDNFINQGINMRRPDWLGPEQLNLINSLVLVVSIPLFDRVIFPFLRARGFRLGPITRITLGFLIVVSGFIYVTVLQIVLYNTGPFYNFSTWTKDQGEPINDLAVWWQMPPYAIIAISEIFASATGLEFAFKRAPVELKSVVMSLFLLTNCGGALIGMGLAPLSKDPYMVTLFAVQTIVLVIATAVFWFLFRKLDDDE